MTIWERLLWCVFGLDAIAAAVGWYRFERDLKRMQRRHEAELDEIRRGTS